MKAKNILHLPEYLRQLRRDIDELYKLLQNLNHRVLDLGGDTKSLNKRFAELQSELQKDIAGLRVRDAELEHSVVVSAHPTKLTIVKGQAASSGSSTTLFADNHDLDAFYLEFENRFRGTEAEIKLKQEPYIKLFKEAKIDKKLPIVDLGCGRGEFLELLTENGLKAVGVDMNEAMVKRARERGFEAVENDAINYLLAQPSGSSAGITGFHLAEHIPFDQLLLLISESYRCLAKGGILLLETPNPESVYVGAFTFHYDPSHLKPLPPAIVQFAAQFKGFARADILRMQPELTSEDITKATKNITLQDALRRLYGPRDYALVAYK